MKFFHWCNIIKYLKLEIILGNIKRDDFPLIKYLLEFYRLLEL